MRRLRLVLLGAWGVLVLGSLLHFVLPRESPEPTADGLTEPVDELAYRTGSTRAAGRISDLPDADLGGEKPDLQEPVPDATPPAIDAAAATTTDPEPVAESFVATVIGDGVASSAELGATATEHWFPSPTQFGSQRVFLVTDQTSSPDFVKVALPVKPNGQEGWIARSAVDIQQIQHRAVIDLTNDSVSVWNGDEIVVETGAVTGKPATPTPVGTFYVRDIIAQPQPGGAFGPYIVALSGFSEVLDTFNGGLPALAIHGTNRPEQIGSERSSGCIRIPNDLISIVAESVPLGTPVTVVA